MDVHIVESAAAAATAAASAVVDLGEHSFGR